MIKQVIILRRLGIRRGKECAQAAHAACAFMSHHIKDPINNPLTDADKEWLAGAFTKICLIVESEQELLDIHNKALEAGIRSIPIVDRGLTEFDGVPTLTCIGIGPDDAEKINKITGHLKLY